MSILSVTDLSSPGSDVSILSVKDPSPLEYDRAILRGAEPFSSSLKRNRHSY